MFNLKKILGKIGFVENDSNINDLEEREEVDAADETETDKTD